MKRGCDNASIRPLKTGAHLVEEHQNDPRTQCEQDGPTIKLARALNCASTLKAFIGPRAPRRQQEFAE